MKSVNILIPTLTIALALAAPAQANILVNDTWLDGTRTDPASPTYAENNAILGSDADSDGNLESSWYKGGAGTLDPVGPGGPLRGDLGAGGTSSGSWTTFFTPSGTSVNLMDVGDQLTVTWAFTLQNVGAQNTSQNFRVALVDTPEANRLTANGSPINSTYTGYGMLNNMGVTLGRTTPFRIVERSLLTTGDLLSTGGNWAGVADDTVTVPVAGYAAGTLYTFVMSLTRTAAGLDIASSITGGTLGGDGNLVASFSDPTPSTYSYDTFSLRPSSAVGTAQIWDTTLFKVEFVDVPEPATSVLGVLGLLGLIIARRMRR